MTFVPALVCMCCEASEWLDHQLGNQRIPGLVHITVCQIAIFVCLLIRIAPVYTHVL